MTDQQAKFGNGVNLQPSYYNNGEVTFGWDLMKQARKIETVRIEIEPDRALQAQSWIQQACGQGYDVIATYHKSAVLGTDARGELRAAADWWRKHYRNLIAGAVTYSARKDDSLGKIAELFYGNAGKYDQIYQHNKRNMPDQHSVREGQPLMIPAQARSFTINLMNEWGSHDLTARDYAAAYNEAIGIVREVTDGPIIIDAPGWGQETFVAASAVKADNPSGLWITDPDIILSVHIYREAYVGQRPEGRDGGPLDMADLDELAKAGRPCMVGEFGPGKRLKPADWSGLVEHAKRKGWPVLAWAWNGDGKRMNMVTPPWKRDANPRKPATNHYFKRMYELL